MPLPRTNAQEHPSASHSDWGGNVKLVVQPVMAKHPDQPDKWTVSGVARSYASKEDADKVRAFLKKNPPSAIKQALDGGEHVDDMLPGHLQKLPHWDDIHGTQGMHGKYGLKGKRGLRKESDESPEANSAEQQKKAARINLHRLFKWGNGKIRGEATMKRHESATLFSDLGINEALEQAKEALECGCIDKMEDARDAILLAMCEAGCPPMQHMNKKLGRCAKVPSDLHQAMQSAHMMSRKSRTPEDHQRTHQHMHDVAGQLQHAGFHQLASLHAARAHAHKLAAAN